MGYIGNGPYQGVLTGGNIQDGTVETTDLADGAVTTAKINDGAVTAGKLAAGAAVPDQTGQSGKFLTTDGTNASWATIIVDDEIAIGATAPSSPIEGQVWYDTGLDILKTYDGTKWNKVSPVIPTIASISGDIYETIGGNITITGTGFLSDECSVEFSGGFTTESVNVTASSNTSLVVAVPAAAYASTGTVTVKVTNADNGKSTSSTFSVVGVPTGGTVTTSGNYRIHTFTSSSSFVVPSGLSLSNIEYLVIAGGGSGGGKYYAGGGGAGGYRSSVPGELSGGGASAESTLTLSSGTYTVTVGAGAASSPSATNGTNGSNSTFATVTSLGGGGGHKDGVAKSGGSGGGGDTSSDNAGGSGTSGQGYAGASGHNPAGGGGGGASEAGKNAISTSISSGGNGLTSSITGTAVTRAGGGGGAMNANVTYFVAIGGSGGGGNAGADYLGSTVSAQSGDANKGSGGGGACWSNAPTGGAGGSGIVIIRYAL
jgi:hypothetical protein